MEAEIVTQAIDITVRGPKSQLAAMTEKDFTVTVDFTNQGMGTYTVKPIITVNPDYAEVGFIGSYSISVSLVEAESQDSRGG